MRRVFSQLAVLVLTVAALGPATAVPARAATTIVVDDDGAASVADCNAPTRAASTIQGAVISAAPGDTVKVCPGTYDEAVVVNKTLDLRGPKAGQNAFQCPARSNEATVTGGGPSELPAFLLSADDIRLDGFRITETEPSPGVYTDAAFSGYVITNNVIERNPLGVELHASGATETVVQRNCIRDNNQLGRESEPSAVGIFGDAANATIYNNAFRRHRGSGLHMGNSRNIRVQQNTSRDEYMFAAFDNVRSVRIAGNYVRSTVSPGYVTSAIMAEGENFIIRNNDIRGTFFYGLDIRPNAVGFLVERNYVEGTDFGIRVIARAPGAVEVLYNTVRGADDYGIFFGGGTSQNFLAGNNAKGSGLADCRDDSPGVANTWVVTGTGRNIGPVAQPARICVPD